MRPSLSEIIRKACGLKTEDEQIEYLHNNQSEQLMQILQWTFDKRVKWLLPEGDPPYTPCPFLDQESMLYNECKRLYLFVEGGPDGLTPLKREALYIGILEAVHPDDAKLLLSMKTRRLPFDGLTVETINKAFPGLIHE